MLPYYCIFFLLSSLSCFDVMHVKKKQKLFFLFLLWGLLALFAGFRANNPDWDVYYDTFVGMSLNQEEGFGDVGFNLLSKIILAIFNSPIAVFWGVACISVALNLNSFRKYSASFLICVLYYFVHLYVLKDMIQIRAGLASAICLYAIRYLELREYKKYIFITCLAISMHFSAIVCLLILLFYRYRCNRIVLKYLFILCLLIGLVCPLGQFIKMFLFGIDERLSAYIMYGDSGFASELGIFTNLNTVKSMALFLIAYFFYNKLNSSNRYFVYIFYIYALGVYWLMIFNDFAIIGARMSNILLSVEPILISYLLSLFADKSRWIILLVIICVTYLMLVLNMAPNKIVPYQFYFS
ncbi:EpsG family protein [Bacteroides sp. ET71]|uniref:EpsG family protein n=1 Tax=Bacteroides sp. ET71 TaxID=2939421 RepID=UPI0020130457|nr:EpsG family protein [Bacteroides sp. ET71]MCL1617178.1 EpsG family protein [Bacteroides sp. ET71]